MEQNIPGKNLTNKNFFLSDDVVATARNMLGKRLVTIKDGVLTSGIISETEAYGGISDKASHAYGGRRTNRTEVMFWEGGCIYVYLCYGIHSLFNIVTNHQGIPDAVLVRGVIPEKGKETMMERRKTANERILADGPGKLSQAMGIHHRYSGMELNTSSEDGFKVWIEDTDIKMNVSVESGKRVGIDYAGDDALLPWRFKLKKSPLGKK